MTAAPRLRDVTAMLETLYPLGFAEDWDRVGLIAGVDDEPVQAILLALDPTIAVADEAADVGAQLLITHHPLLLKGASHLPATTGKGAVLTRLLRARTALWCGHTNADRADYGTTRALARALGLRGVTPLLAPTDKEDGLFGLGIQGTVAPTTVGDLAQLLADRLPPTVQGAKFTGDADRPVQRVVVCPGAGDSLLNLVAGTGADVYITSDLRHHPALEHLESRADHAAVPALIDVPHWASESMWLPLLKEQLEEGARRMGWQVEVRLSEIRTDPWSGSRAAATGTTSV